MESSPEIFVYVHTGDRKNAATNNKVMLKLYSDEGKESEDIYLNHFLTNEFERDKVNKFRLDKEDLEPFERDVEINRIEIWTKKSLFGWLGFTDDWFVDKIIVENVATNRSYVFPVFRWIKSGSNFMIKLLDTSLPQDDEFHEQRKNELEKKKKMYKYAQPVPNGPIQVKSQPDDEKFSFDYQWNLVEINAKMIIDKHKALLFSDHKWESIDEIKTAYEDTGFPVPRSVENWDSDVSFGQQRLASLSSTHINLLKDLPKKFPVTDELLGPLLEGLSLHDAISSKSLYIIDLAILEGIPSRKELTMCHPFALFFVNNRKEFLPVAIQLFQDPSNDNPIFTPLDPPYTWMLVKMWYNNAEAQYHQCLSHLGFTHLLMEGFVVVTHRNLSPTHPMFKLLAPHFLYLIAINWRGMPTLLDKGGWFDTVMNIGSKGAAALIARGVNAWTFGVDGDFPEDIKRRGVDCPDALPGYYFRDDGLLVFAAIKEYVAEYVAIYYETDDKLEKDWELQHWAWELYSERNGSKGGAGFKDIPGGGHISNKEDLVKILTSVIFTCSALHAAVNFPQYDQYGFPPNYPGMMKGLPPKYKNAPVTEQDILNSLVDQNGTYETMIMTTTLSSKGTNKLGDFETQYVFDPRAKVVVDKFRDKLEEISEKIKDRNLREGVTYDYLDPDNIPNAISI